MKRVALTLAIGALLAGPVAAQQHQHGMKHDGTMPKKSGWVELDAFHAVLHTSHHAMMQDGDVGPARKAAATMAEAAGRWASSTPPAECKAPADTKAKVDALVTEAEEFAKLVAGEASDADVKAGLDKLHRVFMPAHMTCMPDMKMEHH